MRLRWTARAAEDLQGISDYLKIHHPSFRQQTMRQLYQAARSLKTYPRRGRRAQNQETRELLVLPLPYIVIYRVEEQDIEILSIYHTSQNQPSLQ